MGEDHALAVMWRRVDECSRRLSARDRRLVRDAIANSVLEGHPPTREDITLLVKFAAGELTFEQYKHRVLERAGVHRETGDTR